MVSREIVDVCSARLRIENIKKHCVNLLNKDLSYYSYDGYKHLWQNFARILKLLKSQYPGTFTDVPDRTLVPDECNFEAAIKRESVELLKDDIDDCIQFIDAMPFHNTLTQLPDDSAQSIPIDVRRDCVDIFRMTSIHWCGKYDEVEFLRRLYNIDELPSEDYRFPNASGDIWQHRVNNWDWTDDWVFNDRRFELMDGPDSIFLDFLCQTLHPVVQRNAEEIKELLDHYNVHLSQVGWQIHPQFTSGGRSIYTAVKSYSAMLRTHLDAMHTFLSSEYITQLINRMHASIEHDPELAIGSAKEFVESICKTILNDRKIEYSQDDNLQKLVKKCTKELKLDPDGMPESTKALDSIKPLLGSLGTIAHMTAELRGQFGTGHGKHANTKGLGPRHARLAVGSAASLGIFLYETFIQRQQTPDDAPKKAPLELNA